MLATQLINIIRANNRALLLYSISIVLVCLRQDENTYIHVYNMMAFLLGSEIQVLDGIPESHSVPDDVLLNSK